MAKEQNLEQSLNQLEDLVKTLEDPNLSIDEAIEKYSQGMQLAVECRRNLSKMSQKITLVRQSAIEQMNQIEKNDQAHNQGINNEVQDIVTLEQVNQY